MSLLSPAFLRSMTARRASRGPGATTAVAADETVLAGVGGGVAWSTLGTVLLKVGNLAIGVVAARLMVPSDFGVFAIALIAHAVIVNISDAGVSAYLVRHPGPSERLIATVFSVALAVSLLLAVAMAVLAPALAHTFGSGEAAGPIRVLSLTVLLGGVTSVPNSMLVRAFRQKARFAADSSGFLVSAAVLVVLAADGHGAMALAWSRVLGQLVSGWLAVKLAPRLPRPGWDASQLPSLLRFGLPLVGNTLLGFALYNVDFVVIGRLLDEERLGAYYLAFNIANWPYMLVAPVLSGVALTAFARVLPDPVRLTSTVGASLGLLLSVTLPACLTLAVLAEPLVEALYGRQWLAAAPSLSWIALYAAVKVPVDLLSNLAIALGRTSRLLAVQVLYGSVLAPLTVVMVSTAGIVGAGLAHVVAVVVVLLPATYAIAVRGTALQLRALSSRCAAPLLASVVSAGCARLSLIPDPGRGPLPDLLLGVLVATVVYVALMGGRLVRAVREFRTFEAVLPQGVSGLDERA